MPIAAVHELITNTVTVKVTSRATMYQCLQQNTSCAAAEAA